MGAKARLSVNNALAQTNNWRDGLQPNETHFVAFQEVGDELNLIDDSVEFWVVRNPVERTR